MSEWNAPEFYKHGIGAPKKKREAPMKRVEAIRQRISNATLGPWEWDADVPSRYDEDYYVENAPWLRQAAEPNEAIVTGQIAVPNPADATLIASAPADLTYLLDRLERAENKIEHLLDLPAFKGHLAICMCTTCIVAEEARQFLSKEA